MTAPVNPTRLRDNAELSGLFCGIDAHEQVLSTTMFESVGETIKIRLSESSIGAASTLARAKLWKLVVAVVGLGAVAIVGVSFVSHYVARSSTSLLVASTATASTHQHPGARAVAPTVTTDTVPEVTPVTQADAISVGYEDRRPVTPQQSKGTATRTRSRRGRNPRLRRRARPMESRASVPAAPDNRPSQSAPAVAAPGPVATTPRVAEAKPRAGTLAQQLSMFEEASRLARRGQPARALQQLDRLRAQFPDNSLRSEIALARAEYLVAAKRTRAAISHIESLVRGANNPGKHAQLLRVLGDLYRDVGDCARATSAYERAIAYRPHSGAANTARRGIESCRRPKTK